MQLQDLIKPISSNLVIQSDVTLEDLYKYSGLQLNGCLFVVDNSELIGFISDGDLRRIMSQNSNPHSLTAKHIMTRNLQTANKEMFVVDAFRLMSKKEINHLPILDNNKALIGYVTYHQLASMMSPEQLFINLHDDIEKSDNELRHLARYHFAANFIRPGDYVLDCACGSGYGSNIISNRGAKVLGIDLSKDSIAFAKERYEGKSTHFESSDVNNLSFAPSSFNTIITLETLEHIPNDTCKSYIANIAQWLKPGGILIASSPMLRFVDDKPYITNPYHINELPKSELILMFNKYLPNFTLHFYHQKETSFIPLDNENTGFCILVARKRESDYDGK